MEAEKKREVVIRVRDLYKVYRMGDTKVYALNGVDLDIRRGEFCAITGPSGSGKSTLLNMLAGLEHPSKGEIVIAGKHIEKLNEKQLVTFRRERVGFIFQSYNLIATMDAVENVALPLSFRGMGKARRAKRAKEYLKLVGLERFMTHMPNQMSGGQQQRVAIARALALKPDILCFDEPTSALDPELTGEVLKVIRTLAEQKTTMIIVTHEMAFARDVADQLIFMDGGVIVEQGDPHQVIDHPKEERTKQFLTRYAQG